MSKCQLVFVFEILNSRLCTYVMGYFRNPNSKETPHASRKNILNVIQVEISS